MASVKTRMAGCWPTRYSFMYGSKWEQACGSNVGAESSRFETMPTTATAAAHPNCVTAGSMMLWQPCPQVPGAKNAPLCPRGNKQKMRLN